MNLMKEEESDQRAGLKPVVLTGIYELKDEDMTNDKVFHVADIETTKEIGTIEFFERSASYSGGIW